MANTKYPLKINGVNFQVNPTNLSITKPIVKGSVSTQAGVRFQIWYNQPEILTINGLSTGTTAQAELMFLKRNYEVTNTTNISTLFYKTKNYRGFIDSIEVGHSVDRHQRWPYTIVFQFLQGEQFNIQDFSLAPSSGVLGTALNTLTQTVNAPIARANVALGSVLGKFV